MFVSIEANLSFGLLRPPNRTPEAHMLKYDTFCTLLEGEGLGEDAWFHIFPGKGEAMLYYQRLWAQGRHTAMENETRYQTKRNFKGGRRIFHLLPLEGAELYVFVGAHDILSDDRPQQETPEGTLYMVENRFNPDILPDCIGRLVVKWHRPLRWRYPKAETAGSDLQLVGLRERPFGAQDVLFPGFHDFHWTFAELCEHAKQPLVAWQSALASVAGIYAITDCAQGVTYLGSAYGKDGIWGRWVGYAKTQHNGNKLLKKHVAKHGTSGLLFSVLLTMDLDSKKEDAIAKESFYKRALGTRVHGLNDN
jgi:hypothetical protein